MRMGFVTTARTAAKREHSMLSERHSQGIEDRSLSVELAVDMGLRSARRSRNSSTKELEFVDDVNGDVLVIPFMERGVEVNCKYRWAEDG